MLLFPILSVKIIFLPLSLLLIIIIAIINMLTCCYCYPIIDDIVTVLEAFNYVHTYRENAHQNVNPQSPQGLCHRTAGGSTSRSIRVFHAHIIRASSCLLKNEKSF